jgi:hypothetical protein
MLKEVKIVLEIKGQEIEFKSIEEIRELKRELEMILGETTKYIFPEHPIKDPLVPYTPWNPTYPNWPIITCNTSVEGTFDDKCGPNCNCKQ